MPLDLDPIRKRLAMTSDYDLTPRPLGFDEYYGEYSECGDYVLVESVKNGVMPPLAVFVSNAPGDIAALLAEVERLRAENSRIPDNIVIDNKTAGEIQQLIIDLAAKVESLRAENKALRAELEKTNGKVQKLKKALQRCHDEDDERRLQLR